MTKKKGSILIFDCQLLQTKAWHRGMGKYTAKVIDAFLTNDKLHTDYEKVVLLFNDKLAYSDELKAFAESQKCEVKMLTLDTPKEDDQHSITLAQGVNRSRLDNYIAEEFRGKEVAFCITSLFLDEACPTFPSTTYNSLIYYDLIPLMYYRLYLGLGSSEQYFTRFAVLFQADQIFAISETVANDIVTFLGFPKEKVINIRGASNHTVKDRVAVNPNLPIDRPFVLMPTGGDPRKNNLNGVKGFNLFNQQNGNRYQLVITSIFTDQQKEELYKYSDDILFSDNVSDGELWWLYEQAEVILFPTEYEGLGMPILEAIDANKLIACSDIPVFREISTKAFFTFDPIDPEAIGNAIEEAVIAKGEQIVKKTKHYKAISDLYTWESTAEIVAENVLKFRSGADKGTKPRVAIVTPNICQNSEAARYVALQYMNLRSEYDIDFFYDMSDGSYPVRPSYLAFLTEINDVSFLTPNLHASYDLVVSIIENTAKSIATMQAALALPGLVILTDDSLEVVYNEAAARGKISTERLIKEADNHLGSISLVAKKVGRIKADALDLAYANVRDRSLSNQIFVSLDSTRPDDKWNIDYINEISKSVDQSRVNIIVVTRTRFNSEVRKSINQPSVVLYEDVSDHEYNTLLTNSDLYIDARPGDAFNKLFPAFEAQRSGLTVLINGIGDDIELKGGMHIADSAEELYDMTYKWLIDSLDRLPPRKKAALQTKKRSLLELIQDTIDNK